MYKHNIEACLCKHCCCETGRCINFECVV